MFFTREEMRESAVRVYVRNLAQGNAQGLAAIEQIRRSGMLLMGVGRDWAATANPLNYIGTVLLGNPDSLRDAALTALKAGDLQVMSAATIDAERAASLSGLTGTLMTLLVTLGVGWVLTRRRRGLPVVPSMLAEIPHRSRAYATGWKGRLRRALASLRRNRAKLLKKLGRVR